MADDKITIFFEPKGDKALVKAINSLARAQARLGSQTNKSTRRQIRNTKATNKQIKGFQLLGGTLSVVRSRLLVMSFALALVNKIVGSFVRLAMKQEDVEKKLSVQLGYTSKSLLEYASAQQKVTQFGDEEVISVMGQLAAFTKNEEQIKALTQATLDLSEGMGLSLNDAGLLIGKTFGSTTNSLSRYAVAVKGTAGSQKRLESLTDSIAIRYGDLSKNIDTTSKALKQMGNALGDAAEEIGKSMLKSTKEFAIEMTELTHDTIIPFIKTVNRVDFKQTFENIINNGQVMVDFFIRMAAILPKVMVIAGGKMTLAFFENFISPLMIFFGTFSGEIAPLVKSNFKLLGLEMGKGILEGFISMGSSLSEKAQKLLGLDMLKEQVVLMQKEIDDAKVSVGESRVFKLFKDQFEKDIFDAESLIKEFGEAYRETIEKLVAWQKEQLDPDGEGEDKGSWFSRMFKPTEDDLNAIRAAADMWGQFNNAIGGVTSSYEKMMLQKVENARQTELEVAQSIRSETKRQKKIDEINKKYDKEAKKRKEEMRDIKIAEAISNTALGITKAYTEPFPMNLILAALIATQGALQVATIKAQKYQYGGMVGGQRHSQGGTMIEAERGEFVVSRGGVNAIGIEALNRINAGGGGGSVNISFNGNVLSKDFIEDEAIPQIKEAIRRGADIGVG